MLKETKQDVVILTALLEDVIPYMEAHPDQIDFSSWESPCGTYKCLLGWATTLCPWIPESFGLCRGNYRSILAYEAFYNDVHDCLCDILGEAETYDLFSGDPQYTLAARKTTVQELLAERI